MRLRFRALLFCLMICAGAVAATQSAVYDAAYMQRLIGKTAKEASGRDGAHPRIVQLPAGRYVDGFRVPNGTKHLVIRGAGIGQTIFEPYTRTSDIIRVGKYNHTVKFSEIIPVQNVKEGDLTVTTEPGAPRPKTGTYYCLYDQYSILNIQNDAKASNRQEIVQVDSVTGSGPYRVTLRFAASPDGIDPRLVHRGAAREYTENPALGDPFGSVCEDITLSNFEVRGTGGNQLISAALIDGLTLRNIKTSDFGTNAYKVFTCSNVLIDSCQVSGAKASGPGGGYGFAIYRSRGVRIQNCSTDGGVSGKLRHAYILHSGATDVLIRDCTSTKGSLDMHGFDERRCEWRNVESINGLDVGNNAWLGGAKDVLFKNCKVGGLFGSHANVSGLMVEGGSYGGLLLQSSQDTLGRPAGGITSDAIFRNVAFKGRADQNTFNWQASKGVCEWGKLSFLDCSFGCPATAPWRRIFESSDGTPDKKQPNPFQLAGDLLFERCTFSRTGAKSPGALFVIQPGSKELNLTMRSCTFQTGGASHAISVLNSNGRGNVQLEGNQVKGGKLVSNQNARIKVNVR